MKTAVIYARYSCDKQTEQSIEGQLRICNEYAQRNNISVVNTYIDRATTGTNDKREAFQQMLKDSNKKTWDLVIVYKLDRFSRDKYETAMHRHTLKVNGVKLVSAMENIPDTPEGIILESLLEGMNQYYSAELSQKATRGMRETRNKGNFTGGTVLYGYYVKDKKVYINEQEAEIVRYIFNESAAGKHGNVIMDELNEKGVLYRGKPFAKTTFYRLVSNEKYIGIFKHDDEVFTNIYPAIISNDLFEIVKAKLTANRYGKHKADVCYLLKNKLFCGYCGKIVGSGSGLSSSGKLMRYYRCSGKIKPSKCNLNAVRKELLEKIVAETTFEILTKSVNISILADRIIAQREKRIESQNILTLLENDYAQTEKAINNILIAMENGIFTSSTKERLEMLEEKRATLSAKISAEVARNKLQTNKTAIVNFIKNALKKNPRQMIDILVNRVILYNDKIEIYYNYINKRPDGDNNHQAFSFYEFIKALEINKRKYQNNHKYADNAGEVQTLTFNVVLFI